MATEQREPSIPLPGSGRESSKRPGERRDGPSGGGTSGTTRERSSATGPVIAALVVGLILGVLALKLIDGMSGDDDPFAGIVDEDRYQAVILSNDKVYFGRIDDVSSTFFELDDAFFLRETRESADAEPERSLLPVNRELHAPENRMLIRKDEVVLVENLAEDSPVLAEIERQKGDG